MPVYKRILIKISGEALAGESGFGLSDDSIANLVEQIKTLNSAGVENRRCYSAAEISGEADRALIWTGLPPTIWVCLRRR